jgi:hypothetical protein
MPENLVDEHRKALRRLWASKAWKEAKALFLIRNPYCDWCKRPSEVPHHEEDTEYLDLSKYIENIDKCTPMCRSCHRAGHRGLTLCPVCREHYKKPGFKTCWHCRSLDQKEASEVAKIKRNNLRKKLEKESREKWLLNHSL